MGFRNTYEDANYAAAYAAMEFPGTYALAFRDLPEILARHVRGRRALDFGCGAGRSTRFLSRLGFDAVGVDISPEMIRLAREADPAGAYRLNRDGEVAGSQEGVFDVVEFVGVEFEEWKIEPSSQIESPPVLFRRIGSAPTDDGEEPIGPQGAAGNDRQKRRIHPARVAEQDAAQACQAGLEIGDGGHGGNVSRSSRRRQAAEDGAPSSRSLPERDFRAWRTGAPYRSTRPSLFLSPS